MRSIIHEIKRLEKKVFGYANTADWIIDRALERYRNDLEETLA
jgi:hypothetical protein